MAIDESYIDQFFIADDGPSVSVVWNSTTISVVPVEDYTDSGGMSGIKLMYDGKETDWTGASKGDAITKDAVAYSIAELKPNQEGWIRIKLRRT